MALSKTCGGQSVFWYDQWLATGDKAILDIVNYNEDDVRTTEHLYVYILKLIQANTRGNKVRINL